MNGTIDDRYFEWLYSHIGSIRNRNPARSWWSLARQLYITPFKWYVPNDDNRIADGLELRMEFLDLYGDRPDTNWVNLECSVFEMLLALARRAAFDSQGSLSDWFWTFMDNMELREWSDKNYNSQTDKLVNQTLSNLIDRNYREDGLGGLFPLKNAKEDQRKVEIWYQMSLYLLEREYEDVKPY